MVILRPLWFENLYLTQSKAENMNEIIATYRPLAEFMYFLTGPLILVWLMLASYQLRLTRKEMQVRFRREATLLTLDICDNKLKKAANLSSQVDKIASKMNTPSIPNVEGCDQSAFKGNRKWLKEFNSDDKLPLYQKAIDALSEIETFSEFIQFGLVDDELAFKLEGVFFLELANDLRPYLAAMRQNSNDVLYNNIVELEKEWLLRLEKSQLVKKRKTLWEQIKSILSTKKQSFLGDQI